MMKNRVLYVWVGCLISCSVFAQDGLSGKERKALTQADGFMELGGHIQAHALYKKLWLKDSNSVMLNQKMGICLLEVRGKEHTALHYLQKGFEEEKGDGAYYLGRGLHLDHQFDGAIKMFNKAKETDATVPVEELDRRLHMSVRAKEYYKDPRDVVVENLSARVNSDAHDYVPLITADEKTLFFTSRRKGGVGNKKDNNGNYFDDIYMCRKDKGVWRMAHNLGTAINTEGHDATVSISADGKHMILYRSSNQKTGGDLYHTENRGAGWMEPQPFNDKINTEYQEPSACFSSDLQHLYFSSNRPGGYGGSDLYIIRRFPDGTWAEPQNLGPAINTPFDEDAPFLLKDDKTLYFASNGHSSIGGFDVFKVEQDVQGDWGIPQNMGYPINTVGDDLFFSLNHDGTVAYYASHQTEGKGGMDIYSGKLLYEPASWKVITGQLTFEGKGTGGPELILWDVESDKEQGRYTPHKESGKFILAVASGRNYQLRVVSEHYQEKVVSVKTEKGGDSVVIDLELLE